MKKVFYPQPSYQPDLLKMDIQKFQNGTKEQPGKKNLSLDSPYSYILYKGDSYDLPNGIPGILFSRKGNLVLVIKSKPDIRICLLPGMLFYCEMGRITTMEGGEFMFYPIHMAFSAWSLYLNDLKAGNYNQGSLTPPVYQHKCIQKFLTDIETYLEDGIYNHEMHETKTKELFILLRYYYNKEEVYNIFYIAILKSNWFRRIVFRYADQVTTAGDFLRLTGMKRSSFEKRFRMEFGITAHQWILKQKAELVKQSLINAELSIDVLRKKHGFNSATHFVRFCRQQFGMTPTQFRRKLHSEQTVSITYCL